MRSLVTAFSGLAVLLSMVSCARAKIEDTLKTMLGQEVTFPHQALYVSNGQMSLQHGLDEMRLDELVYFFASQSCTMCTIQKLKSIDSSLLDAGFSPIFIMEIIDNLEDVKPDLITETRIDTDLTIIVDFNGSFAKDNAFLPKETEYHTFLIGKSRKILAVGDPLKRTSVRDLELKLSEMDK